jgi:hypothetical protein
MLRRTLSVGLIWLGLLAAPLDSGAEVRVRTDRQGHYDSIHVRVLGARWNTRVWTAFGRGASGFALNPQGDRNGDGWPTIAESPSAPHLPWVVWSRYDGSDGDYDLAWSRWTPSGWEPVRWVAGSSRVQGDDMDADLGFDDGGQAYLVWWAEEEGTARVYFSFFLTSRWLEPVQISDLGEDSRHPVMEVIAPGYLRVQYETPSGILERTVKLSSIDSITDDISPVGHEVWLLVSEPSLVP